MIVVDDLMTLLDKDVVGGDDENDDDHQHIDDNAYYLPVPKQTKFMYINSILINSMFRHK